MTSTKATKLEKYTLSYLRELARKARKLACENAQESEVNAACQLASPVDLALLKHADPDEIELAIRFLEVDGYFNGSGTLQAKIVKFLKRVQLSDEQRTRICNLCLKRVNSCWRQEFKELCKLAAMNCEEWLLTELMLRAASRYPDTRTRAKMMLHYCFAYPKRPAAIVEAIAEYSTHSRTLIARALAKFTTKKSMVIGYDVSFWFSDWHHRYRHFLNHCVVYNLTVEELKVYEQFSTAYDAFAKRYLELNSSFFGGRKLASEPTCKNFQAELNRFLQMIDKK